MEVVKKNVCHGYRWCLGLTWFGYKFIKWVVDIWINGVLYRCHGCGNTFRDKRPYCPHCGAKLSYDN